MDPVACILDRIAGVPATDADRHEALTDLAGWVRRGGFVPKLSDVYAEATRRGLPLPPSATVRTLVRRGLLVQDVTGRATIAPTASTPERIARVREAVAKAFANVSADSRADMADAVLRAVKEQVAMALHDAPL